MPANLFTGDRADALAAYIAKCAGVGSCGVEAANLSPKKETATPKTGGKSAGKEVFTANCAGCHTLADAGASATVGPNLDKLKPSKETVAKQVEHGGGGMPAFKGTLSDEQIDAVASYVSDVAGK